MAEVNKETAPIIHVYPQGDLVEHVTVGTGCWCIPTVKRVEGGFVVVHNSADGREIGERERAGEYIQ